MLNESNKRLRSSQHSEDWIVQREDKAVHNGKIRCFVCLKDNPTDNLLEESDYQQIFLKSRTVFHNNKLHNSEEKCISQANANLLVKNSGTLIHPCNCDKAAHSECLYTYCLINITFECQNCRVKYAMKFTEEGRDYSCGCFSDYLILSVLLLLHAGLLALSILLFMEKFELENKFYFWQVVLGVCLTLLNLFLLVSVTVKYIVSICKKKISPEFLHKSSSDDFRIIDSTKGDNLYNVLTNKHNCNELELLEKKRNNIIFLETIIKDEMKITQFINQNNTIFNLKQFTGADELLDAKNYSSRSGLIKPTYKNEQQYLRKQKSYTLQNSGGIKPPVPNQKGMLVKSKTKNSEHGDLNLLRKMNTKNSKNKPVIVTEELHAIREEEPNRLGTIDEKILNRGDCDNTNNNEVIIHNLRDVNITTNNNEQDNPIIPNRHPSKSNSRRSYNSISSNNSPEEEHQFLTLKENLVPKDEHKVQNSVEKIINKVKHSTKVFSEFEFEPRNEIKNTANYMNCDVIIEKDHVNDEDNIIDKEG